MSFCVNKSWSIFLSFFLRVDRAWILASSKLAALTFTCIECFLSRGEHLCKFIGTKESVCIRKEFNSHRTGLGHQHGRRFIVSHLIYPMVSAMTSYGSLTSQSIFCFWATFDWNGFPINDQSIHEKLTCLFIFWETMFTIGESQAISYANGSEQQTQERRFQQPAVNPRRGRFDI